VPDNVNPFAMTKFPKPLLNTSRYYELIRPYSRRIDTLWLAKKVFAILSLHREIGSPVPKMSPNIVPAVFTPDTDAVNKLVISALIPMYRPTIGSQYRIRYYRGLFEWFTFVQLLYSFLTDFPLSGFSAFSHAVQYQPLEREAPQGGLETLPVKRFREDDHQFSELGFIVCETSAFFYSGSSFLIMHSFEIDVSHLIKSYDELISKNLFPDSQEVYIFESVLIHHRTHKLHTINRTLSGLQDPAMSRC